MPSYKLTYFDATGRAELTRLLFKLGGQEFEDVRVPKAEWPKLKPTMPLSTVPVLEVKVDLEDDVMIIPQSSSMERYVARTLGLDGGSDKERVQVDILHTTAIEYLLLLIPIWHEQDEAKKAELIRDYSEEKLPIAMRYFTAELANGKVNFGSGGNFFVGRSATMADLAVSLLLEVVEKAGMAEAVMPKFPEVNDLVKGVNSLPAIKKHLEAR